MSQLDMKTTQHSPSMDLFGVILSKPDKISLQLRKKKKKNKLNQKKKSYCCRKCSNRAKQMQRTQSSILCFLKK